MSSCSIWSLRVRIWLFSCDASLVVTEQEITGRETPHARPRATFQKTFGVHTNGHGRKRGKGRGGGGERLEKKLCGFRLNTHAQKHPQDSLASTANTTHHARGIFCYSTANLRGLQRSHMFCYKRRCQALYHRPNETRVRRVSSSHIYAPGAIKIQQTKNPQHGLTNEKKLSCVRNLTKASNLLEAQTLTLTTLEHSLLSAK